MVSTIYFGHLFFMPKLKKEESHEISNNCYHFSFNGTRFGGL